MLANIGVIIHNIMEETSSNFTGAPARNKNPAKERGHQKCKVESQYWLSKIFHQIRYVTDPFFQGKIFVYPCLSPLAHRFCFLRILP